MKIILVFGGSGFIGSRLVDELKGDYKQSNKLPIIPFPRK